MNGRLAFDEPPWYRAPGGRVVVSVRVSKAARAALSVPDTADEWRALAAQQAARTDCMARARGALYELIAQGLIRPCGNRCAWVDPEEGERRRKRRDAEYSAWYRQLNAEAIASARKARQAADTARRARLRREDAAYAEKRRAYSREAKRRARARARGEEVPKPQPAGAMALYAAWRGVAAVL